MKRIFLLLVLLPLCAAAQVTLQPWVQVFGTTPGQGLGRYVNGITPSANLPYKASISSFGSTGLYTLQTQNDTGAQRFFFGTNMLTGDLNGDGWKDIVITRSGGTTFVDTVVIFWGTSTAVDTTSPTKLTGSNMRESFGFSICMGNLVSDSTLDLIVGAPDFPTAGVSQGRVYIYRGGFPFNTLPSTVINGDSARYLLGRALAIGDINNDGYNDLIVRGLHATTPRFDYVNIYFGGSVFDTTMGLRIFSMENNSRGLACFDANGDGVDDLLWTKGDSATWVYVHYGDAIFDTIPSLRLQNPGVANFGNAIVNAGDMSGDGNIEIAVAASQATITSGFVFIFEGGTRLHGQFRAAVGMSSDSDFGRSVSSVGDVSGDGLADIIIGAPTYEFGNNRGYWGIFKGDTSIIVTDISEPKQRAQRFVLHQAYPNPFNPQTTIEYDLNKRGFVTLKVYTVLGQEVRTLINKEQEAGQHSVTFNAHGLAAGAYFYEMIVKAMDGTITRETKKMLLLSQREKQQQDEYEQHLLTRGLAGDDASLKELARLQYQHAGGRFKQFLLDPDDIIPDSINSQRLQQLGFMK